MHRRADSDERRNSSWALVSSLSNLETAPVWIGSHALNDLTFFSACTRPGNDEIQLDLFLDYASNVALYPKFQQYFRTNRPPLLAVWGNSDPFFLPPGAEAFKRDNLSAEVHFYDTGHFALETHYEPIASAIHEFLSRKLKMQASAA